jgi:hypothetical protein
MLVSEIFTTGTRVTGRNDHDDRSHHGGHREYHHRGHWQRCYNGYRRCYEQRWCWDD